MQTFSLTKNAAHTFQTRHHIHSHKQLLKFKSYLSKINDNHFIHYSTTKYKHLHHPQPTPNYIQILNSQKSPHSRHFAVPRSFGGPVIPRRSVSLHLVKPGGHLIKLHCQRPYSQNGILVDIAVDFCVFVHPLYLCVLSLTMEWLAVRALIMAMP